MISSAVVKRKEIIGKEQRQNHQEMRKDGPKIIVVAPPKVQLNRVYVVDWLCRYLKIETFRLFSRVLSIIIQLLLQNK